MTATNQEFEPRRYVCHGRDFDGNDLRVMLAPVEDAGETRCYEVNKNTRILRPGAVYEIPTAKGGTSIQATSAVYIEKWHDTDAVIKWQLATSTAETLAEASKRHTKETTPNAELLERLRPLRKQYQQTIGTARRQALEITLLSLLRTPLKKNEIL